MEKHEEVYYRKLNELKNSEFFTFLDELFNVEILKHRSGLETARGDIILDMQGRIKGIGDLKAFFDSLVYIIENLNKSDNSSSEESEIKKR